MVRMSNAAATPGMGKKESMDIGLWLVLGLCGIFPMSFVSGFMLMQILGVWSY